MQVQEIPHTSEEYVFLRKVLERVAARARLRSTAVSIHQGLAQARDGHLDPVSVGEMDIGWVCGPDPQHPQDTYNFNCSSTDFNCADFGGNFTCGVGTVSYSNCGYWEWECNSPFDCGADLYICQDFVCDNGFTCDATYDHVCSLEFDCQDGTSFDCDAGHGFFCDTDHECWDNFNCDSPGNPPCTNDYNWGGDQTSGDFTCGSPGGGSDSFDCTDVFSCNGADDFDCMDSTSFGCGGGLPGSDTFQCGASGTTTNFDCEGSSFTCPDIFNCEGDYDCQGYDCVDRFKCDSDYDCTGAAGFDCNDEYICTSSFDCDNGFDCTSDYECQSNFVCDTDFNCADSDFTCPSTFTCTGNYTRCP